jgi:hypothetical protein
MDDMAPAPTQWTYDDLGRVRDENFQSRRKAVKKVPPAPSLKPQMDPEAMPEPQPEPDTDHELDLLA